jgi:hypothetical protein
MAILVIFFGPRGRWEIPDEALKPVTKQVKAAAPSHEW